MRNVKKALTLMMVVILLHGCSVYKDYEPYISRERPQTGLAGWQDFFSDPNLKMAIGSALDNNPDLFVAKEKIIEAQAMLKASRLAFLPSLNASPSVSYSAGETRYGVPLAASWEIDLNGRLLNSKRKAQAAFEQSGVYVRTVQTELVASVAECYYSLLKLDAQLDVSRSTAASWKENVATMKIMKEAGMTNEASISQTEANACSIEASLYDLEYQIRQLEGTLTLLTGMPADSIARSDIRMESPDFSLMDGVDMSLLANRPDVEYSEYELKKAWYDTAIAHAAFYPSITLTGEFGWEKALTSPAGWLVSLGAGLVQPLFRRGALKAELTAAEARQEERAAEFRKVLLKAGTEVNDALALCRSARNKTDVRKRQIEALEDAETSTRMLMIHSESTYLEVLTAQQSLLSARLLQISDKYDAFRGTVALFRALGGGAE